ncbi:MAG: pilus assembly protein TadG-related protein [Actinomycetota bacterium]
MRVLRPRRDERGGVAVLVAVFISFVALVATAWVSEFGLAYANKRFLQNAVEASALAAASHVREFAPLGATCSELAAAIENGSDTSWNGGSTASTASVADRFFEDNLGNHDEVAFGGVQVTCDPSLGLLVTIDARQRSQTVIGRAAGTDELLVQTRATAVVATPKNVVGLRPLGMCLDRAREAAAIPGQEYSYPIDKGDSTCGLAQSTWGLINFEGSRGNGGADGTVSDLVMGYPGEVSSSTVGDEVWIDGSPGLRSNLVGYVQDLIGDEIVLPVYDVYRDKSGGEVPPLENWPSEGDTVTPTPAESNLNAQARGGNNGGGSSGDKDNGKDFRIVGFITVEITGADKDEIRFRHKRFSPVAKINRDCALGLAQCDLGARIVKLVG